MKNIKGFILIIVMILIAVSTRLFPHLPNFTAIGAMTLFGSAYLSRKYLAIILPLVAMWLSDLVLNNVIYSSFNESFVWFQSFQIYTYLPIIVVATIGVYFYNNKVTIPKIFFGSVLFPVVFFLMSNFGTWLSPYSLFTHDFTGLVATYIAGLPYLGNDLLGTLIYSSVIFGSYFFITKQSPSLLLKHKLAILSA